MKLQGGSFLIKKTLPSEIFIPEEFNEEQRALYHMVKEFLLQEIHGLGIEKAALLDASKDMDFILSVFHKAADQGLCSVAIEEQYGGMDLDFNTNLLISEVLSLGFSFATTLGAQTSIGSLPIVLYGNEEQKSKYLPGVANGSIKAAYALTEPTAGSDANSGKTKAILTEDKKNYLLTGQKMWITNGGFADLFIVFAKIADDEYLSAFIVEKAFGGITLGPEERKLGIKASSTVQVFFENTPVPVENLLGKREGGFKMALNILNTGRIKLAVGSLGGSKFGITKSIEYAKQRKQFDKPLSDFGAIKHKIGEMIMQTHTVESACYRVGKNIDKKFAEFKEKGLPNSEAKLKAVREYAIECAILKVAGSEVVSYSVDEALQIHGGMGYSVETGMELGYRDARITRIYEGTNEINRMLSVAELTKRALKTKEIDLISAGKKIPLHIVKEFFSSRSGFGEKMEERIVQNLKILFLLLSGTAGKKLGKKMVDEQEIVMNLADILSVCYVAQSSFLRYRKWRDMDKRNQEEKEIRYSICQLNLYEGLEKTRKYSSQIIDSFADGFQKKTLRYTCSLLLPKYNVNPKDLRRKIADYGIKKGAYPFSF